MHASHIPLIDAVTHVWDGKSLALMGPYDLFPYCAKLWQSSEHNTHEAQEWEGQRPQAYSVSGFDKDVAYVKRRMSEASPERIVECYRALQLTERLDKTMPPLRLLVIMPTKMHVMAVEKGEVTSFTTERSQKQTLGRNKDLMLQFLRDVELEPRTVALLGVQDLPTNVLLRGEIAVHPGRPELNPRDVGREIHSYEASWAFTKAVMDKLQNKADALHVAAST